LFTRAASAGPSPKPRNRSKTCRIEAMLAAISWSLSSRRVSSLPEGSPTLVVPPPISTIGLWPVRCSQRSSMIETSEPTCRLSAVASKPM
jgi:hypothetical protein